MSLAELLPKVLESNLGCRLASGPQQSHHFAKHSNSANVDGSAADKMFDEMAETLVVRPILHHERREPDLGIDSNVSIFRNGSLKVYGSLPQTAREFPQMFRRSDNDHTLARFQSGSNETGKAFVQGTIRFIELREMFTWGNFSPEDLSFSRTETRPGVHLSSFRHA